MSIFSNEINDLSIDLLKICKELGIKIATAESCTGGLIAAALTDIAGSSAVVDRGFVTYSNAAKQEMLGVKLETLNAFGAVSQEVALEMGHGAVQRSNAQLAVAVTGVAGPDGGSIEKPVGLVHIAAIFGQKVLHEKHLFGPLSRSEIRLKTVRAALLLCVRITS
jgi:nicotinamide-nucleotide amidase